MTNEDADYTAQELADIAEKDRRALSAYLHLHEWHVLSFASEHSEDGGDTLMCEDCDRISDGVEINGLLHKPDTARPVEPPDLHELDTAVADWLEQSGRTGETFFVQVNPDRSWIIRTTEALIEDLSRDSQPDTSALDRPCPYCHGRRWVNDENWTPDDPKTWRGERYPHDGLTPCGGCNEGGWDTPVGPRTNSDTSGAEK